MSTLKVNPVMYLISNPRVEMSKGKFAAQAAHAAVEAFQLSPDDRLKHIWNECGKHYAKVVLQSDCLLDTWHYIHDRGFNAKLIYDEGLTEFDGGLTLTFLGVQIVDKNRADVQATFGQFKLYKDPMVELERRVAIAEDKVAAAQAMLHRYALEEGQRSPFTKLKERLSARTSRRDSRDS